MALSKSALKAKFGTGAIPTQANFENLIDKIPNNDKSYGEMLH